MTEADKPLLLSIDARGIATATLNRPGRLNACTAPLGEALRAAG